MQQEQVLASLLIAADGRTIQSDGIRTSTDLSRQQMLAAFGRDDGIGRAPSIGTVQKLLMMLNGPLTAEVTAIAPGSFLDGRLARSRSSQEVLDRLFLTALAKPATADVHAARELMAGGDDLAANYQDIWWALLNSNEFIINH